MRVGRRITGIDTDYSGTDDVWKLFLAFHFYAIAFENSANFLCHGGKFDVICKHCLFLHKNTHKMFHLVLKRWNLNQKVILKDIFGTLFVLVKMIPDWIVLNAEILEMSE